MRNFGERAALFQHSACRLGPARRWYKLGLILLISPSVGLAQLNHIETATRLLGQGQMEQAETEARQALGNPTTRPLGLALLGTIRLQEGKYTESTSFLTQALALKLHWVGARPALGSADAVQAHR